MSGTGTKSLQRKIQENLRRVRRQMADACRRANRDPESVRLIAVTKSVEVDIIKIAMDQGLTDLAENRVQHLTQRAAMIAETLKRRRLLDAGRRPIMPTWHMVGHLQRNKVKSVLQWSNTIHSVDSLRLAEEISSEAQKRERVVEVLLQINVAEEKSKYGLAVGATDVITEQMCALPGLRLIGLMTMVPLLEDAEQVRPFFRRLREVAEDLHEQHRVTDDFRELSMGMTNDFEVAIEEGATMVRIGTALFEGLSPARC